MLNIQDIVRSILPYGIVRAVQAKRIREDGQRIAEAYHQKREAAIADAIERQRSEKKPTYSYEDSIAFLVSHGCPRIHVEEGSMPEASLKQIIETIRENFDGNPITLMHIGNFVGISLTYLTHHLVQLHPDSLVVSIDPNLRHRGIERPAEKVISLLNRYGLQRNSIIMTGYSLQKSVSNDGVSFEDGYDPLAEFAREQSCETQVANLAKVAGGQFSVAMVDGNHEANYLETELSAVVPLLKEDGLLVVDDISEHWKNLTDVFNRAAGGEMQRVCVDGRIGILRRMATAGAA